MRVRKHPLQNLYRDKDKVVRFVPNAIVMFLLDTSKNNLNDLARMSFPREDWEQFAQLIGYSLSGFSELDYVSSRTYDSACRMKVGPR